MVELEILMKEKIMLILSDREVLSRAIGNFRWVRMWLGDSENTLICRNGGTYTATENSFTASGFPGDLNGHWEMDPVGNTFTIRSSAMPTLMFHVNLLRNID